MVVYVRFDKDMLLCADIASVSTLAYINYKQLRRMRMSKQESTQSAANSGMAMLEIRKPVQTRGKILC
jgi:hypothetical protein